jgi:hypothetical protein
MVKVLITLKLSNTIVLTSPTSKVCVFSELFRYRKTEIVYFTLQFLNNCRSKLYILQVQKIKEARVYLESFKSHPEYKIKAFKIVMGVVS